MAVRRYADLKLRTAKTESERALRRLEALKQEQQRLLQLSYRDLVDEEVLAAEQVRIRSERAQVGKWAKTAALDAEDITKALEEALRLLEDPARRTNWPHPSLGACSTRRCSSGS